MMEKKVLINNKEYTIEIIKNDGRQLCFKLNDNLYEYSLLDKYRGKIVLDFEGDIVEGFVEGQYDGDRKQVFFDDHELEVELIPKVRGKKGNSLNAGSLQSPMPGKIFKIMKNVGENVLQNEPILIMEAMKMEHTIRAHKDGVLSKLFFKEGEQVQGKAMLAEIE